MILSRLVARRTMMAGQATSPFESPRMAVRSIILGAVIMAATAVLSASVADAAELVMIERAGCTWCAVFDREIAPIYAKTSAGRRAPLRRVDVSQPMPDDLRFVAAGRLTPAFVLVADAGEVGRIRGYPGVDYFWALLDALVGRLDAAAANEGSRDGVASRTVDTSTAAAR
jgi:hypothetical protein